LGVEFGRLYLRLKVLGSFSGLSSEAVTSACMPPRIWPLALEHWRKIGGTVQPIKQWAAPGRSAGSCAGKKEANDEPKKHANDCESKLSRVIIFRDYFRILLFVDRPLLGTQLLAQFRTVRGP